MFHSYVKLPKGNGDKWWSNKLSMRWLKFLWGGFVIRNWKILGWSLFVSMVSKKRQGYGWRSQIRVMHPMVSLVLQVVSVCVACLAKFGNEIF